MKRAAVPIYVLLVSVLLALPRTSALPTVTTAYSANWSGYVATAPAPYTYISASWTVPSVSATSPPAYSSVWVGIGGWYPKSNRLIQAGTEQDVLNNGSIRYSVWREVYPNPAVPLAHISAGDSITVTIAQVSANATMWRILIVRNSGTMLDVTVRARINLASEDTAEFIVERPAIQVERRDQLTTLANFGTVRFSSCSTNQGALASLTSAYEVTMTSNGTRSGTYLARPDTLKAAVSVFSVLYSAVVVDEFPSSQPLLVLALISSVLWFRLISRNKDTRG